MLSPYRGTVRTASSALALSAAMLLAAAAPASAAALRSPWDGATLPAATGGIVCPTPPGLPKDIAASGFYTDAAHSIADPARLESYRLSVKPLHDAARKVAGMADRYRRTGEPAAARCAATWLAAFARQDALGGRMAGNQSTYVEGWIMGAFALDWLKIRAAPDLDPAAAMVVPAWLGRVADHNRAYYDPRAAKKDGRNNHRYWAGLAVMAAGIAADRRDAFDWGLDAMRIGLRQVAPDGTLPIEMERRAKALHYHLFAAAPLVAMAELAQANGIDAYAENDGALRRLAERALSGVADPGYFAERAAVEQEPVERGPSTLAWAVPFERRFPDAGLHALLARLGSADVIYLGGEPPP